MSNHDEMHHAMKSVLEDMGRAAREGRARRFTKRPAKGVEVSMGEVTMEPASPGSDVEVDPVKAHAMSEEEERELLSGLEVQR